MANRRSTSMWAASKEDLRALLTSKESVRDVLSELGIQVVAGGHYHSLTRLAGEYGLEAELASLRESGKRAGALRMSGAPLQGILIANSPYTNRGRLKIRLLAAGLLKNECAICGMGPEWQGAALVMVLDHINGVNNDNRLDNLRLLCPNCNSQTPTFSGRNTLGSRQVAKAAGSDPAIAGSNPASPAKPSTHRKDATMSTEKFGSTEKIITREEETLGVSDRGIIGH